ncbi:MAG TPA: RagB/SusD family nutrient uptake outer membrane protein [Gemmatimonadaceae bacterium]|nr:RagB/SusD family nutrient uptake outer membrane protein [Gemmatimonadaceae bacterium]
MRNQFLLRAVFGITTMLTAGCRDLTSLQQSNPGALDVTTVFVPANAVLITNGAIADFECAFSRYVVGTGLFADELSTAIASTANFDFDRRTLPTNAPYGTGICGSNQQPPIYTTLSTARGSADTAAAKLRGWTDAQMPAGVSRVKLIGQTAVYAGYSLVLLGESMCSAAINVGPELTPAQLFAEAKIRFDSAVVAATAASDAPTLNLALLGRARNALDLGDAAAAGVDAAKIPATFAANMGTNGVDVRRENFAFIAINQSNWATVESGFRGVTINGAADSRVAVTNTGKAGTAAGSILWTPDKYSALTSTMPIARYAEAQLIVAESKLAANDLTSAVAAINIVRATHPGLPAYDGTGQTAAQVKTQLIEERRRELFLEGHRLGDLRRYGQVFSPAAGTAYAGGGGVYGTQTCFPLPDVEKINNPNISKS